MLTVVDAYTRECVALEAAARFGGQDVAAILSRVALTRGLPQTDGTTSNTVGRGMSGRRWPAPSGAAIRNDRRDGRAE